MIKFENEPTEQALCNKGKPQSYKKGFTICQPLNMYFFKMGKKLLTT